MGIDDGEIRRNVDDMGVQVRVGDGWVDVPDEIVLRHVALPPPSRVPWSHCEGCETKYKDDFIWAPGLCASCAKMHEGEQNARLFGKAVGAGPYRTAASSEGNQLPRWKVLLGRVLCFINIHSYRGLTVPYHTECIRCGTLGYVGP